MKKHGPVEVVIYYPKTEAGKEELARRVADHQAIRDAILAEIAGVEGVSARPSEGGSYLFITLPEHISSAACSIARFWALVGMKGSAWKNS